MTEQHNREWQNWAADWRAATKVEEPVERIRGHVRRRSRLIGLWLAVDTVVGITFLAVLLTRVVRQPDPLEKMMMGLLALVTLGAVAFGWWNWRDARRATAETTATYLGLSLDRSRRFARSVRAGWIVLALEVAVFVPWIWLRLHTDGSVAALSTAIFAWGFLAFMSLSGAWALVAFNRWVVRDRRALEDLRRELENGHGG